ncbi:MAG: hypothetical protein NTX33_05365 [Propionibacteriales bacterium]|nr:hypothetical protein [Propionibacteriales bacterium]
MLPLQTDVGVVPLSEVMVAGAGFAVIFGAMGVIGIRIRAGRAQAFRALADRLEARTGIAGWAVLPVVVCLASLVIGAAGMMWDVNQHIENGRDEGLISQPSHVLSLVGLVGAVFGSWLSLVLPRGVPSPSAIRLSRSWHVPAGGLVAFLCMSMTIVTFPLDDVWHRVFGLDVSLWSPIHFVLMGSAVFGAFGLWFLMAEGAHAGCGVRGAPAARVLLFLLPALILAFPSILLDEWNLGLPQAAPGYELVVLALGLVVLVALRVTHGRGAALVAWLVYVGFAGLLMGYVLVLGFNFPKMPLVLGFALGVEVAAALVGTARVWRFASIAGFTGTSLGVATDFGWSWLIQRPLPWEPEMVAHAFPATLLAGVGAAMVGAYIGNALERNHAVVGTRAATGVAVAGIAAVAAGLVLVAGSPGGGGSVQLDLAMNDDGTAITSIDARFDPADVVEGADYVTVISYQGDGLEFARMVPQADGSWHVEGNFPVTGSWKTMLRISKDGDRSATPLRAPADPELGLEAIPVETSATHDLVDDLTMMQRERKPDTPQWLWTAGLLGCVAIWLAMAAALGAALRRVAVPAPAGAHRAEAIR